MVSSASNKFKITFQSVSQVSKVRIPLLVTHIPSNKTLRMSHIIVLLLVSIKLTYI